MAHVVSRNPRADWRLAGVLLCLRFADCMLVFKMIQLCQNNHNQITAR
ncbi:conserved hypothetical protein (plasmid) [Neisseria gonorrhoeae DGI2]|uniref:Uncharacterized protein n=1 Tax=Neisseria gonorrhoeae (strain NCCP11945) TaxID=521006 RepID=B4RRF8_NEIG2|nr:hypothetical protein NGK_p0003 [Neisseria gonorrhoeae NCCP11945]EFE02992.1 conserved hypothetical protein [Neisseria gonorrhoeae DGI2]